MVTFRSILLFSVLKKQNQTNNAIQEEEPTTESKWKEMADFRTGTRKVQDESGIFCYSKSNVVFKKVMAAYHRDKERLTNSGSL